MTFETRSPYWLKIIRPPSSVRLLFGALVDGHIFGWYSSETLTDTIDTMLLYRDDNIHHRYWGTIPTLMVIDYN